MSPDDDFDSPADAGGEFTDDPQLAATWDSLGQPSEGQNTAQTAEFDGPQSWSAPMRQRLSSLPSEYRDVIEYATRRDKEQHEAYTRASQDRAQIRRLAEEAGLPAEMPVSEMVKHLQHHYGPGHAADQMREMAERYQAEYEPLRGVLDQHRELLGPQPAETLGALLEREMALRTNPANVAELARQYGYEMPAAEHVAQLQAQLAAVTQREGQRLFEEFAKDRPYLGDEQMQWALIAEMRQLVQETPGLKGPALLKLAHDALAEKTGISKQIEAQRQQHLEAQLAARDQQWMAHLREREAVLARQAEEHTKQAKRAAQVNMKGSPGHNSKRASFANDDDTLRAIWNKAHGS